jgi:two-component system KDP operon response regulator KdpE
MKLGETLHSLASSKATMISQSAKAVLFVDDEAQTGGFAASGLEFHGYNVELVGAAEAGLIAAAEKRPDLVILALSQTDRMEFLRTFRSWTDAPLIVISARSEEEIGTLKSGADDYMVKPFSIAELAARCEAKLRRYCNSADKGPVVRTGQLAIDLVSRSVLLDGTPVEMTRKESRLLQLLGSHLGGVVTHNYLVREIWGRFSPEHMHQLRLLVCRIRKKIECDPVVPQLVTCEIGVGYRLEQIAPAAPSWH